MSEAIIFITGVLVGVTGYNLWIEWDFWKASRRGREADRIFQESNAVYQDCIAAGNRGDWEEFKRLKEKHRELKNRLDQL